MKRFFTFGVLLFLIFGCPTAYAADVILNIRDFGARPNDGMDDAKAFIRVLNIIEKRPGNYKVIVPEGVYDVFSRIVSTKLTKSINFVGQGKVIINTYSPSGFALFSSIKESVKLNKSALRNDVSVVISSPKNINIKPGDIIHIESDTPFETAWNYKEHDTHRVESVRGNTVYLKSPLIFNYQPADEKVVVNIYKQTKFTIENIDFVLKSEKERKNVRTTILTLLGASVETKNVKFDYTGSSTLYHVGLSVVAGENIKFLNTKLENLMYGVLLNYSRNVYSKGAIALKCRHAFAPAQACYNVYIEDLYGKHCQSVMDAHPSFLVHYKNVIDTLATQYPNCRSLGMTMENIKIYVVPDYYKLYAYWSVQNLSKEYEHLYGEYDVVFRNVNWVAPKKGSLNGITAYTCRNFIVEGCTTHSIAYYGNSKNLKNLIIKDSRVGVLRSTSNSINVSNTIFDGDLNKSSPFVFHFGGTGKAIFSGIQVKNFDSRLTYLVDNFYNQHDMNSIKIENSDICELKGFAGKVQYKDKQYNKLMISNSVFEGFREKSPNEVKNMNILLNDAASERLRRKSND